MRFQRGAFPVGSTPSVTLSRALSLHQEAVLDGPKIAKPAELTFGKSEESKCPLPLRLPSRKGIYFLWEKHFLFSLREGYAKR